MILQNFQRHWFRISTIAFFFSFIYGGISDFPQITILLDHIEHHQFNNSPYLPNIQQDYSNNNLKFDGSLPIALSSYQFFNNPFLKKNDTNNYSNSFFCYRQGDYLYRDLIVNKSVQLNDSLTFDFVGQTRSFPGPYNDLGPQIGNSNNSLQNYHLSLLNKSMTSSNLSIEYFYHRENISLPIFYDQNSQFHESSNFAVKVDKNNDNYYFNSNIAFQNGSLNINDYDLDYLTIWSDFEFRNRLNKNLFLNFNYKNKLNNFDLEILSINKKYKSDISIGIDFKKNNFNLNVGLIRLNKNIRTFFISKYQKKEFKLELYYEPVHFFNMESPFNDTLKFLSKLISFKGINFYFSNEIFSIKNRFSFNYIGFDTKSKLDYLFSCYELNYKKINFIFSSYNSLKNKINQDFLNFKLQFSPVFPFIGYDSFKNIPFLGMIFWNSKKRYEPFFNIEGTYIDWVRAGFSEIGSFDLIKLPRKQYYWSWGLGFDVYNFRFTWKQNYLGKEYIYFSDPEEDIPIHPIGAISFFQIDWRFND
ncbi:MAG: hypothetical protein CMF96_00700 [Candidatus Marinimicrobia bacterium]|nr:hypothetical protein [Candidatus Neomarinimicrobiota bacterium]